MRYLSCWVLCLLIPMGTLDYLSIKINDVACIKGYRGLNEAVREFRVGSMQEVLDSTMAVLSSSKAVYTQCLSYSTTLQLIVNKAMTKYSSLGEAVNSLCGYILSHSDQALLAFQEILGAITNQDVNRLQYVFKLLLDAMAGKEGEGQERRGSGRGKNEFPHKAKDFAINFLQHSGLLPKHTPETCLVRIEAVLNQVLEAGTLIWTLSDVFKGVDRLFRLDDTMRELLQVCPETLLRILELLYNQQWLEANTLFQNVMQRSGLIASNAYNAFVAFGSSHWSKLGAWLGLAVFNLLSPVPYDDSLLPSVYNS
jgi:hypothetical protein